MKSELLKMEIEQLAEAPEDTLRRLRHIFPDLADKDLLRMALQHPCVMLEIKYWKQRIARHKAKQEPKKGFRTKS